MSSLFSPFTLKSITLRNRIGVSPMCVYSSQDGLADDWHLVHLGSRAMGGAGLVIAEATAVSPDGRITPDDAGIWSDQQVEPLVRINRFVKSQGAVAGIQLAHAGRKAGAASPWSEQSGHLSIEDGGWETIAPTAEPFGGSLTQTPREMTPTDISRVQQDFVEAAKRSLAAGYEWMELHAAHGYLNHQFLSPISNQRTDAYGGSFENRIRFLLETTESVRAVWPESLPFTVRLSCTDWVDGGWCIEESVELSQQLRDRGVDLIDCSSGGAVLEAPIPDEPNYQVPFAEQIKREAGIATAAVGQITKPEQAEAIVREGHADLVLLAREFLRDAYWPRRAALALGEDPSTIAPRQYGRAW